jgi:hypothetical protein
MVRLSRMKPDGTTACKTTELREQASRLKGVVVLRPSHMSQVVSSFTVIWTTVCCLSTPLLWPALTLLPKPISSALRHDPPPLSTTPLTQTTSTNSASSTTSTLSQSVNSTSTT